MTNTTETTASADALLPCPSGHDEARVTRDFHFHVECFHHDCPWLLRNFRTQAEAIAAWNDRARTAPNASEGSALGWITPEAAEVVAKGTSLAPHALRSVDVTIHFTQDDARLVPIYATPHAVEPTPAPVEGVTDEMVEAALVAYHDTDIWQDVCQQSVVNERVDMRGAIEAALRARQRPNDDVSAPRGTDCEAIRDKRIGVLARAEDGSAAMTMLSRHGARRRHCIAEGIPFDTVPPPPPRDFDPGTVIATLTLDDGRTASDRVTGAWAAQVLRELGFGKG